MSTVSYLDKLRGEKVRSGIAYPKLAEVLISGLGAFVIIGLLTFLNADLFPAFIVPFGATTVLIFAAPAAPFSQPRNVIGGHVVAAAAGLLIFAVFGQSSWWAYGLASALSISLMVALKCVHPPAGATALLPLAFESMRTLTWIVAPVAIGAVILVIVGILYNNVWEKRRYPTFWW